MLYHVPYCHFIRGFTVLSMYSEFPMSCRFNLPPHLVLKNFEALDLGKMDKVYLKLNPYASIYEQNFLIFLNVFYVFIQTNDSGLASYVASQVDRSLSWTVYASIPSLVLCTKQWIRNWDTVLVLLALLCGNEMLMLLMHNAGREVATDNHLVADLSERSHDCRR